MSKPGNNIRNRPRLPERLAVLAEMVSFRRTADIGCDHGLLTAYLLTSGKVDYAVASDINKKPLEAAEANLCGSLPDISSVNVSLRLGDGLAVLTRDEVDCCIIAGIGGMNICGMLRESPDVASGLKQLVLSPERDMETLRRYLRVPGFCIVREVITEERGHFYFAMDARPGRGDEYDDTGYMFGQQLLEARDPVLLRYLRKEERRLSAIPSEDGVTERKRAALRAAMGYYQPLVSFT